jgi:hypothetical protein
MASSALVLHKGGQVASLDEVESIVAPQPLGRWFPLDHGFVLRKVKDVLGEAGFEIQKERYGLSHENARFFGVLDLVAKLVDGVSLSVGIRNSFDKTFPIGFCAGSRVFVCDNLSFSSELLVRKKHTRNGAARFVDAIGQAMMSLKHFQEEEAYRIRFMRNTSVDENQADSLILRAYEKGIVSSLALPSIIKEWRAPSFPEFEPRTRWSLLNAFTSALGKKAETNPHAYASQTMRLTSHFTSDIPRLEIANAA